jgi:hypothetical protein
MANLFTRFFRKISYCEELQSILKEEEELMQRINARYPEEQGGMPDFAGHHANQDRNIIMGIWQQLIYLETESRKLEELKKLLAIEEGRLTERDRKAINQIRVKFERSPLWLHQLEEHHRLVEEMDRVNKGVSARYRAILKEIEKDEIQFWKFLYKTNWAIRKEMLDFTRGTALSYRESRELIILTPVNKTVQIV